jgi:hypothetical protein
MGPTLVVSATSVAGHGSHETLPHDDPCSSTWRRKINRRRLVLIIAPLPLMAVAADLLASHEDSRATRLVALPTLELHFLDMELVGKIA